MAIDHLTTAGIRQVFTVEIVNLGGKVKDVFDDGNRLYARSILPADREVRPKDRMNSGVALRATEVDIWIHPYLFRQVCKNGAITAQAIQTEHVSIAGQRRPEDVERMLREAVRACAAPHVFSNSISEVRSTLEV